MPTADESLAYALDLTQDRCAERDPVALEAHLLTLACEVVDLRTQRTETNAALASMLAELRSVV